jgi:hypothetical protein
MSDAGKECPYCGEIVSSARDPKHTQDCVVRDVKRAHPCTCRVCAAEAQAIGSERLAIMRARYAPYFTPERA